MMEMHVANVQRSRFAESATFAWLCLALLSACTQPHNSEVNRDFPTGALATNVDKSLVTDKPCAPPCWYEIKPGETSVSETQRILSSLPFVKEADPLYSNEILWRNDWGGGYILFDDSDKVKEISYTLEYDVEVKDLVAKKGIPGGFLMFPGGPHEGSNDLGEIQIYWPNEGLIARVPIRNMYIPDYATSPPIRPNTRIDGVIYVQAPVDLTSIMRAHPGEYHEWNNYQPLGTP